MTAPTRTRPRLVTPTTRPLSTRPSARGSASPGRRPTAVETPPRSTTRARPTRRSLTTLPGRRTGAFLALLALVGLLSVTGLVMILSASSAASQATYGSPWFQFQRQLLWLAVSLVALAVAVRFDYRSWRSAIRPGMALTFGMLILVLVPGVGVNVNGSSRWLGVGPFTVQPSELAKLVLLLFTADLLARRAKKIEQTKLTLRPVLVVFVAAAALIMAQPNLGTTVLIFIILMTMLFVSGVPLAPLGLTLVVATVAGFAFAITEPYRMRRLSAFADPWADPLNTGYQTLQSQAALANGGVVGQGLGQGRAKYGFLPEGHTDFIFSNVGEELGLLGAVLLLAVFVAIAVIGIRVAMHAPDRFGMLVATGVTTWILVQAFVNLGGVVGVLPITGVPLPFVSFGGSSLIVTMAAFGLLLNVARQSNP